MPTVRPDPSDCAVPPRGPSEPTGPLAWTPESLKEDWPAPVRPEPAGGASVQPMPPTYIDPTGDTGSDVLPLRRHPRRDGRRHTMWPSTSSRTNRRSWIPRSGGSRMASSSTTIATACPIGDTGSTTCPAPREMRTATTGRGGRISTPVERNDSTDRDTTTSSDTFFKSGYPASPEGVRHRTDRTHASGLAERGHGRGRMARRGIELDMPFYAWASVILNGRVVATDYAPDAGWLLPSPGAKPRVGTYVVGSRPIPGGRLSMTRSRSGSR